MAKRTNDGSEQLVTPEGEYVPEYTPGPVAAGEVDPVEKVAPDYDRLRRIVPTERQGLVDPEAADVAALEAAFRAPATEEPTPKRPRREVAKEYLESVDPRKIEGPKPVLWAFGIGGLAGGWDELVTQLAAPEIAASYGDSVHRFVWLAAIMGTASMFMALPMGYMADRVNRVKWWRAGQVAGHFTQIWRFIAPNAMWKHAGGVAANIIMTPGGAVSANLLPDLFPSRSRARVMGFVRLVGMIGTLIGIPIVGFTLKYVPWQYAILLLMPPSVLVTALTFKMKEPVRGAMDRMEMGVSREAAMKKQPPPSLAEAMRGAWNIRSVRYAVLADFAMEFTTPMMMTIGFISANEYAMDPFQRSLVMWLGVAVNIPMVFLSTTWSQRFIMLAPQKLMLMSAAFGMISIPLTFLPMLRPPLWLWILVPILAGIPRSVIGPALALIGMQCIPARYRGVGMQVGMPFRLIAIWCAPLLLEAGLQMGLAQSIIIFSPFMLISALFQLAGASSVARDMRAARAAALAHEESSESKKRRQNKILICRDLDVLIDEVQILSHVDLDVREGEIVALVGTNGAGKSTLLRAICGLQPAANGSVFYDGKETTFLPTHEGARGGVVYMPGGQGVFPLMSVRDNLTSAAWMHRSDEATVAAGVERVLEMFPLLRERLDAQAGALSGGEQQMLAVSQALLVKPKLLMIDELSLGLAPAVVEQLLNTLRQLREEGVSIILVEQSLNVALTIADRAVFMEKGEIKFDGPVEELLARPDLVRSVFMGGASGGGVTVGRKRKLSALDAPEVLLRCEDVSVSFGGVAALTSVSLEVAAGEVVGIIGPNGAGKTTLFDVLSGYLQPDSGVVYVGDRDVTGLTPDARARLGLGRAFQNARLFPPLTVRETISVAMDRRAVRSPLLAACWAPQVRRGERKLQARVDGFIELLGLTAYADKFIRELSTGTRRAVEVCCQMAAEPKMLLLDEPSSGLAQAEAEALGPALARIVKETGCGMLIIEHDLTLITRISDRLIAMELGAVVTSGTPDEVMHDSRVLRSYLAASSDVIDRSGSRVGSVLAAVADELPTDLSADPSPIPPVSS